MAYTSTCGTNSDLQDVLCCGAIERIQDTIHVVEEVRGRVLEMQGVPVISVALLNSPISPERVQGLPVSIGWNKGPVNHLVYLVRHGSDDLRVLRVGVILEIQTVGRHAVQERAHGGEDVLVDDRRGRRQLVSGESMVVQDLDLLHDGALSRVPRAEEKQLDDLALSLPVLPDLPVDRGVLLDLLKIHPTRGRRRLEKAGQNLRHLGLTISHSMVGNIWLAIRTMLLQTAASCTNMIDCFSEICFCRFVCRGS